jgi:hypothetical protein
MFNTTLDPPTGATRKARRDILEFTTSSAKHKIDRERGVIHDVKIIGSRSRNGGLYPPTTLSSAKPLYEGARVNIDHPQRSQPDQERTFGDWFGVLQNVRHASDGLYGDLSYLMTHPLASQICEAAERFPASFGLSHNAQVTEAEHEGNTVYEKIHHVRSVDIVCKPATTRGIFESETLSPADDQAGDAQAKQSGGDWDSLVRQLLDVYCQNNRPANRRRVATELFGAVLDAESSLTGGASPAPPASDDESPDLAADVEDAAADSQSLESALAALPAGRPSARSERTSAPAERLVAPAGRSATPASGRPAAPAERPSAWDRARTVLEGVGLEAESSRVAALAGLTSDNDRQALINGWLTSALAVGSPGSNIRPRSAGAAGVVLEAAAAGKAPTATNWADPKLATLALLSR